MRTGHSVVGEHSSLPRNSDSGGQGSTYHRTGLSAKVKKHERKEVFPAMTNLIYSEQNFKLAAVLASHHSFCPCA